MRDLNRSTYRLLMLFCIITLSLSLQGIEVKGQTFQHHLPIAIIGNAEFNSANGVSAGDGSFLNPFIIQNLAVNATGGAAINITSTTDYFIVENVVVFSSQYGIVLRNTVNGQVSNTTLAGNQNGAILLFSNATLLYNNNFLNNAHSANDTGGVNNYWDNGYEAGGNYWSDYAGGDKCSGFNQNICPDPDGIGDTPYIIPGDSGSSDDYPLMKPYLPDVTSPVWPSGAQLTYTMLTAHSLTLKWPNATDDTGVTLYIVYKDNAMIANVTANHNSYTVTGLEPATSYTFKVEAGDHSDNWSTNGPSLTLITPSIPWWSSILDFLATDWYLVAGALVAIFAVGATVYRVRRRLSVEALRREKSKNNGTKPPVTLT